MNKQDLIEALEAKKKLCYNRFFEASRRWNDNLKLFGDAGHIVVRLDAEKMVCEDVRIKEIDEFIHMIESLED